ncbi:AAA family ATPase [Alteribacillus sp. JSM 102045]|uniref:AAA family ATPase n=1 Tax=Alteribacillus sp. JSM 102045 TaxID=1562101 RepID=UPI0035C2304A
MNNSFLINKVCINNFRGYQNKEFEFFKGNKDKRGLILLAGPNGYGKTSFLDAIEWCLTGTIRRLEEEYGQRKDKTVQMQKGLLKNNLSQDNVTVCIDAEYNNKHIIFERSFDGQNEFEGFNIDKTTFIITVDGQQKGGKTIDSILGVEVAKYFYDRFTCSYEKNLKMYEKSRTDIYEIFSTFFGGTDEIEKIINNLDGYQEGKGRNKKIHPGLIKEIDDKFLQLKKEKVVAENTYNKEKQNLESILKQMEHIGGFKKTLEVYPNKLIYKEEKRAIDLYQQDLDFNLKYQSIKTQKKILEQIKYLVDKNKIFSLSQDYLKHLTQEINLDNFKNHLFIPFREKEEAIVRSQGKDFSEYKNKKNRYEEVLKDLNQIKTVSKDSFDKLKKLGNQLLKQEHHCFTEIENAYEKLEARDQLLGQLQRYKTTDLATKSLRALIDHIEGFTKLRANGHKKCPLCGSGELFASHDTKLTEEAKKALGVIDEERAALQQEHNQYSSELNDVLENIKRVLNNEASKQLSDINKVLKSINDTESIKLACSKFQLNFDKIDLKTLREYEKKLRSQSIDEQNIIELEKNIINGLADKYERLEGIPSFIDLDEYMTNKEFMALDNIKKRECINQFIRLYDEELSTLEINNKKDILKEDIDSETINVRISILNRLEKEIEQNKFLQDTKNKVEQAENIFHKINKDFKKKSSELQKIKQISRDMKKLRGDWDEKIAQEINGPLQKVYKRLNRHTNIDNIDLTKEGITKQMAKIGVTLDDKEVNASNVLSAGQLSIVSLSVFLTVAMGHRDNPFRCYFMDDPIQSMDDLNILSFVDLLRTELGKSQSKTSFIDQLFLTTCDEDLEKLVSHKLKTFNVNFTHLHFINYSEYEKIT